MLGRIVRFLSLVPQAHLIFYITAYEMGTCLKFLLVGVEISSLKSMAAPHKGLYVNVHGNIIHKSPKLEAIQISINLVNIFF